LGFVLFFWSLLVGAPVRWWSVRCFLLAVGSALLGRRSLVAVARFFS
jgi:hypothetical protein